MFSRPGRLASAAGCALAVSLAAISPAAASAAGKEPVSGKATWYGAGSLGACGVAIDPANEPLVAAPASLWTTPNPNEDPLCNQFIKVTYDGTTITVPIKDKCPSCDGSHIDLSRAAFEQLADPSLGVIQVEWDVVQE